MTRGGFCSTYHLLLVIDNPQWTVPKFSWMELQFFLGSKWTVFASGKSKGTTMQAHAEHVSWPFEIQVGQGGHKITAHHQSRSKLLAKIFPKKNTSGNCLPPANFSGHRWPHLLNLPWRTLEEVTFRRATSVWLPLLNPSPVQALAEQGREWSWQQAPILLVEKTNGAEIMASWNHTVDGWNPANQLIGSLSHFCIGSHISQVVQDFRHQQYDPWWNGTNATFFLVAGGIIFASGRLTFCIKP